MLNFSDYVIFTSSIIFHFIVLGYLHSTLYQKEIYAEYFIFTNSILQKTGTDIEAAIKLISDEYQMNVEQVKEILSLV